MVLTKRPELIAERLPPDWERGYPNVWLGTTVEKQLYIERIDTLCDVPAVLHFVVAEPLLGVLHFGERIEKLDWVITGCEVGPWMSRIIMSKSWLRAIRDECDAARVPLFHKQYYSGFEKCFDGVIDGVVRQDFPNGRRQRRGR